MSFFFFKQKTAYEMRISEWSSDVCSSDLKMKPRRRTLPCLFQLERISQLVKINHEHFEAVKQFQLERISQLVKIRAIYRDGKRVFQLERISQDRKSTRLNSSH